MEYRNLGRSGLKVSALSFGAWVTFDNQLKIKEVKDLISCAFDHGVNFFDNAESYANGVAEELMGRAFAELGYGRDAWCVSSKVYFGSAKNPKPTQKGLSRKHIVDACNQALVRLKVDYLDLYFCHRPDSEVPISEICWTMHQLIMAGKVLYWGTSEWSAKEILAAHEFASQHGLIGPQVEQPQYNLLHREKVEREFLPLYESIGLGTTIWSPLASGILSGKYRTLEAFGRTNRFALPGLEWLQSFAMGENPAQKFAQIERLNKIADAAGVPLAQLALAWCLRNPNVSSVILGASSVAQLQQNLNVLTMREKLSDKLLSDLERALIGL
jgi:voltage-dependent potassium channel beta subunit